MRRVTIGRPIANYRVYVVDPRDGALLPPGAVGELQIGGEGIAQGYIERPDLTDEKFLADPYSDAAGARRYRTGDLVRFDREGEPEFFRVDTSI